MSKGRAPLAGGRLALVNSPEFEYCNDYHCAGDCGHPHNQQERSAYVNDALATFDSLKSYVLRDSKDHADQVRQRAKDAI